MKKVNRGEYGYFSFGRSSSVSVNIPPIKKHKVIVINLPDGTIRIKCKKDRCKFSAGPFSTLAEAEKSASKHLNK